MSSVVENGTFAGYKLTQVIEMMPGEVLGNAVAKEYDNKLRAAPACLRLSLTTKTEALATK